MSDIDRRILRLLCYNNDLLRLPVLHFGMSHCSWVMGTLEYNPDAREPLKKLAEYVVYT
jgi:hypothetical protein